MSKKTFVTLDGITSTGNVSISGTLSASANSSFDGNTLFVNATGNNVGVNTQPSVGYALDVAGTVRATALSGDGSGITGINIDGGEAATLGGIAATQFLRSDATDIHETGTLIINSSGLRVNDDIPLSFGTGADVVLTCNGTVLEVAGPVLFTTTTVDVDGNLSVTGNITTASDARLKSNIETLDGSKVYQMRGVSYNIRGERNSGLIAQELQEIAPELVRPSSFLDPTGEEYLSIAYGNIVGYLIEAIKDLKREIDELKSK